MSLRVLFTTQQLLALKCQLNPTGSNQPLVSSAAENHTTPA
jgi:hypothetical protein